MDAVGTDQRTGAQQLPGGRAWTAPGVGVGGRSRTIPLPRPVVAVTALGLALRLLAALHLTPHVDEAASLLAATMVVERGLPILPSGTVYFQGATLSYLLAPFVTFGMDTLGELDRLRLLCALAGAASVPLSYGLARAVGADGKVAAFAAGLVALDPVAVQWSAHLRMYALLQPLTLAFAWLVVLVATRGATGRRLAGLVALAWALTFTHVAALALWPGAALVVAWAHRRSPREVWLRLVGTGVAAGLAPLTLLLLNRTLGSASVSHGREPTGLTPSFVGDHLLTPRQPDGSLSVEVSSGGLLAAMPSPTTLVWLIPIVVLLTGAVVATAHVVRSGLAGGWVSGMRTPLAILLAIGWLPVAVNVLGTAAPRARYAVHVNAIGWIVVAVLAAGALARVTGWLRGAGGELRWRDAALVLTCPLVLAAGVGWLLTHPVVHPNHSAALAYVSNRRAPDQPVVIALPAVAYLTPGTENGLVFLAGPADRPRAERLTRLEADGRLTDYWIGVPAITSAAELRRFLAAHPDAWIVVDEERLNAGWAYAGPIADALRGEARLVYKGPGDVLVFRPWAAAAGLPGERRATGPVR